MPAERERPSNDLGSVRAYYDGASETWDEAHGVQRQNARFARQLRESIGALLAEDAGAPVALELGAGTGAYLDLVAPLFKQYIATDLSDGMLAVLARRIEKLGLANVRVLNQDACDLAAFGDGSVDVVFSMGLLETIPDPDLDRVWREAHRVLKGGGLVAGITSNGDCPWYRVRTWKEGGERQGRTGRYVAKASLTAGLRRAGFEPPQVCRWGSVPPGMRDGVLPALLSAAERVIAPTPLSRFLGVLSFRARKPGILRRPLSQRW